MNELIAQLLRSSCHRFIGRLGSDPEVRYFESGSAVANANIAINKPGAKRDEVEAAAQAAHPSESARAGDSDEPGPSSRLNSRRIRPAQG
jgi:hypothetical protein